MVIAEKGFRNNDPNFSHAAFGYEAEKLIFWSETPSIGKGSFYDKFIEHNGKCLLLGVDYTALPIFMHMEAVLALPYRYEKKMTGKIKVNNEIKDVNYIHYVRDEHSNPQTDRKRIGKIIDKKNKTKIIQLNYGQMRYVPAKTIADIVEESVKKDPEILLNQLKPFIEEKIND